MPRRVPADLEDALAANHAARERFWSLPPEHVDAWIAWVEHARFRGTRRRRVAEAVRRLGARRQTATTVVATNGAGPAPIPRGGGWVWLLALALLAGVAAWLVWLTVYRDRNSSHAGPSAVVVMAKTSVPGVVGLRLQAAQFQLQQAKLRAHVVRRKARKPRGIVVAETPRSGARVPQGTLVTLVVSSGRPGVKVPSVVGLAAADAVKRLQSLKLTTGLEQTSSQQPPGTVLAQMPAAGERVKPGIRVVLQVAKGKASVSVPAVAGQDQQTAVTALAKAGLTAHVVQVVSAKPVGTVVAQNPPAGQKVAQGASVRLNVSKGPPAASASTTQAATTQQATTHQVTTQQTTTQRTTTTQATTRSSTTPASPSQGGNDYRGMQIGAAVQKIAQGRQQVIVVYVASSRPAGVVVANSPAGSRERLEVSAGPQPEPATQVPDVTGEDQDQASSDLSSAGLGVVVVPYPVSDPAQVGAVTYETPSATAPDGSTIVVYIGT